MSDSAATHNFGHHEKQQLYSDWTTPLFHRPNGLEKNIIYSNIVYVVAQISIGMS